MFVLKKQVREVVLHATVVDETDGLLLVSTAATGGSAFFLQSLDQVSEITRALAHGTRRQDTIPYTPQNQNVTSCHPVVVEARATEYGRLTVRTRSGYYTGESVR